MKETTALQDLARELLNLSLDCGRPVSSLLAELESDLTLNGEYYRKQSETAARTKAIDGQKTTPRCYQHRDVKEKTNIHCSHYKGAGKELQA